MITFILNKSIFTEVVAHIFSLLLPFLFIKRFESLEILIKISSKAGTALRVDVIQKTIDNTATMASKGEHIHETNI